MTKPVECYLVGGPLNGQRGPIFGNDHTVELNVYAPDGSVASVERYALGNNPTPTFRYHVGSQCPCGRKTCVESWEPGCGLGTEAKFAKAVNSTDPVLDEALQLDAAYIEAMGGCSGPKLVDLEQEVGRALRKPEPVEVIEYAPAPSSGWITGPK